MLQTVLDPASVIEQHNSKILDRILEEKCIKPVYQPIVSLTDGKIFGYEALSRIADSDLKMDIDLMFRTASKMGKAWELEALCRTKAMENLMYLDADKKLFINVNPNIFYDKKFTIGFTKEYLTGHGLDFHNIIFEITEREAVVNTEAFLSSVIHYRSQNYGIAIDDVGAGYSGLNTIASVKPDIIKLDMSIIRNIDKDEIKQLLCKAMVNFTESANIKLIAEGIQTKEELETLIKMNIAFGQGYFLCIPQPYFADLTNEKIEMIKKCHDKKYSEVMRSSVYPIIGHLSKPGNCFSPDESTENIYKTMKVDPTITEFIVIDNNVAIGFMTKTVMNDMLGGRYGFILHSKKAIREVMNSNFLRVNYHMPVDQVSRLAMQRPLEQLYNPIVIEYDGQYSGIATVKDLLNVCTKIEVYIASHSNPLTGLPGNLLIEKEIVSRIFSGNPYCITYYDIDNFKAYNDAYGFKNGDTMLALVAGILKKCAVRNEFIGHIGGDDFIVIADYHEGEIYCQSVLDEFSLQVASLYRDEDIRNGYIISKNRNGVTENFPIASLSIAGITNRIQSYQNTNDFSKEIAKIKKICKKHIGNYFEIH